MKQYIVPLFLIITVALTTACSSAPVKNDRQILTEAATLFGEPGSVDYISFPSHGAIGDGLAIAAGGGANAGNLRTNLQALSRAGNGKVVITGRNSALVNAIIKGAVADNQFPGVWLVYAGDSKYAESLQETIQAAGMKFGFVDTRM